MAMDSILPNLYAIYMLKRSSLSHNPTYKSRKRYGPYPHMELNSIQLCYIVNPPAFTFYYNQQIPSFFPNLSIFGTQIGMLSGWWWGQPHHNEFVFVRNPFLWQQRFWKLLSLYCFRDRQARSVGREHSRQGRVPLVIWSFSLDSIKTWKISGGIIS